MQAGTFLSELDAEGYFHRTRLLLTSVRIETPQVSVFIV